MGRKRFGYDICLSFAGEDRDYVERVAACLDSSGVRVFYDQYETANLWGKDLYAHLDEVYRKKAQYCIVFISKYYAEKLWTNHERRSIQARAFSENREYVLPARFDDTEIPGILPTIGFIHLQGLTPEAFSLLIKTKLDEKRERKRPVGRGDQFRRIYFEGFDAGDIHPSEIKKRLEGIWLIGSSGHWTGVIANGVWRITNVTGPDAVLKNQIRYYEPANRLIDLGDCSVSTKVRVEPPNDSHSGAGLLFRADGKGDAWYAFFLHPGSSVSFAETTAGKLSFLWSQEIPEVKPGAYVNLKIVGRGASVVLYVDGSPIHRVMRAKFRRGNVGAIALSVGNYYFDEFTIHLPVKA